MCWHFIPELREIVNALPDSSRCPQCEYSSDKVLIFFRVFSNCITGILNVWLGQFYHQISVIETRENSIQCFVIGAKSKQHVNSTTFAFLANTKLHVHGIRQFSTLVPFCNHWIRVPCNLNHKISFLGTSL